MRPALRNMQLDSRRVAFRCSRALSSVCKIEHAGHGRPSLPVSRSLTRCFFPGGLDREFGLILNVVRASCSRNPLFE
jgi:hypothetical protein